MFCNDTLPAERRRFPCPLKALPFTVRPSGIMYLSCRLWFFCFATRKQDIFSPPPLALGSWQCNISVFTILTALLALLLILYFFVPLLSPKIKIGPQGIYILHANRLFTWDEISGASHVVIPQWQLAGDENWFDWEKTLIIHRYQQASVAIPDISIFSLWACKKYSPGLKTNLLTQGIASIIYSAW